MFYADVGRTAVKLSLLAMLCSRCPRGCWGACASTRTSCGVRLRRLCSVTRDKMPDLYVSVSRIAEGACDNIPSGMWVSVSGDSATLFGLGSDHSDHSGHLGLTSDSDSDSDCMLPCVQTTKASAVWHYRWGSWRCSWTTCHRLYCHMGEDDTWRPLPEVAGYTPEEI